MQPAETTLARAADVADTGAKRRTGLLKHTRLEAGRRAVDRALRIRPYLFHEISDRPGLPGQETEGAEGQAQRARVAAFGMPAGAFGVWSCRPGRSRRPARRWATKSKFRSWADDGKNAPGGDAGGAGRFVHARDARGAGAGCARGQHHGVGPAGPQCRRCRRRRLPVEGAARQDARPNRRTSPPGWNWPRLTGSAAIAEVALEICRLAAERFPASGEARLALARALRDMNRRQEAVGLPDGVPADPSARRAGLLLLAGHSAR